MDDLTKARIKDVLSPQRTLVDRTDDHNILSPIHTLDYQYDFDDLISDKNTDDPYEFTTPVKESVSEELPEEEEEYTIKGSSIVKNYEETDTIYTRTNDIRENNTDESAVVPIPSEISPQICEMIRNLHVDMLRQFHMQHSDLLNEVDKLKQELQQVHKENAEIKNQLSTLIKNS
eukprot:TRINITY_DN8640_c0_g2_i1.p1 TRINITY_DN8640_c0_g2~~TRINITY_DN8640_c0_g2_i1.p1  ORF type:complete len:175 (+),score=33.06 TRINITY_DN8640_c0_g2_i1:21-545(+)